MSRLLLSTLAAISLLALAGAAPAAQPAPGAVPNFHVTASSTTSISTAWDAATRASRYQLSRDGTVLTSSVTSLSYVFNGLACGTSYSLAVAAINSGGLVGPSSTISASTAACSAVTLTSSINNGDTVTNGSTWTVTTNPVVDSVEFWADGSQLGVDSSAPFEQIVNLSAGTHQLGLATNDNGVRKVWGTGGVWATITTVDAAPPPPPPPPPPVGSILYSKNWEDGLIDSGGWGHQDNDRLGCPHTDNICYGDISATNTLADTGSWSGKFTLPVSTYRTSVAMLHPRTVANPSDEWFSFAIRVPTGWAGMIDNPNTSASDSMNINCYNYYSVNSCMENVAITKDSIFTAVNSGACPLSGQSPGCPYYSGYTDYPGVCRGFPASECGPWYIVAPGSLRENTWYEIVMHVYYTLDPAQGRVQAWVREKGGSFVQTVNRCCDFPTLQTGPTAFGTTVTASNINGWPSNDYINAYRGTGGAVSALTIYNDDWCRGTTFDIVAACFN